jgi:hypothetical protein
MPVGFVGASNLIATNGAAPGAITPHASTATGDLLIFYHYGRATGGNETVSLSGWTQLFQSVTANNGHVAVYYKFRVGGETTYTATISNYTSGTTGETVLEWIETFSGAHLSAPITKVSASLSTWASSTTLGSVAAPASPAVGVGAMAIVFAGRFENVTAQTTLTGDSLTWAQNTRNDTTQGTDAGAVTQRGLNSSGSSQNITAKSITTTGTTQAGAGIIFIIEANNNVNLSGSVTAPSQTVSGTATHVAPAFNLSAGITAPSQVVSGTATSAAPAVNLSGAVTAPSPVAAGTATRTVPEFNLNGGVTAPSQSVSGSATFSLPAANLSGALTAPSQTVSGTATNAAPVYSLSGGVTAPSPQVAGAATHTAPGYLLSGAVTGPSQTVAGTATRTLPGVNLSGALTAPAPVVSGAAERGLPSNLSGAITGPSQVVSGALSAAAPGAVTLSGGLTAPSPVVSGTATATTPAFNLAGNLAAPAPVAQGEASYAPAVFYELSGGVTAPIAIISGTLLSDEQENNAIFEVGGGTVLTAINKTSPLIQAPGAPGSVSPVITLNSRINL